MWQLESPITEPNTLACKRCYTLQIHSIPFHAVPFPALPNKIVSPGDLPAAPAAPALRLQLRTCVVEHKRTRLLAIVNGADTDNLDGTLPRRHTKQLYDDLS